LNFSRFLLVLTLGLPFEAWGCRCVEPDIKNSYKRADAVALIHITAIANGNDGSVRAQGEVLRNWKSALQTKLEVWTGDDCAYHLKIEHTYLLYLQRDKDGRLSTYICKGNRENAHAARYVEWLDKNRKK